MLLVNHFCSKILKEIEFLGKRTPVDVQTSAEWVFDPSPEDEYPPLPVELQQTACQEELDSAIRELFATVCFENEGKHDPSVFDFAFLRRSDPTLIVRWARNEML
ncbi:hypothetical protein CDAR_191851 [Caerostris darwini]|uniref:Uncharacterized protein n=1 Tax=Caerostris darwini TaxID=1538125 RepID=A0AAV4P7D5_9ARAC|nr:hypothetical protein CDAR_191851 [Caerostris darwini]